MNMGNLNNWKKRDLARVIMQDKLKLDKAPPADDIQVQHKSLMTLKRDLVAQAADAIENINRRRIVAL